MSLCIFKRFYVHGKVKARITLSLAISDLTMVFLLIESIPLQLSFLQCRQDNKTAVLLHLLRNVIKPSDQTVVFVATKHHVEFLNMVGSKYLGHPWQLNLEEVQEPKSEQLCDVSIGVMYPSA